MPAVRRVVLEELMANDVASTTSGLAERVRYPTTTTRRVLEDLAAHGIVERQSQGSGLSDLWQVAQWSRDRWPTVPEMSEDTEDTPGSVPEMSEDMRGEHDNDAGTVPISTPTRIGGGKTGTVPPDEGDLMPAALAAFGDLLSDDGYDRHPCPDQDQPHRPLSSRAGCTAVDLAADEPEAHEEDRGDG